MITTEPLNSYASKWEESRLDGGGANLARRGVFRRVSVNRLCAAGMVAAALLAPAAAATESHLMERIPPECHPSGVDREVEKLNAILKEAQRECGENLEGCEDNVFEGINQFVMSVARCSAMVNLEQLRDEKDHRLDAFISEIEKLNKAAEQIDFLPMIKAIVGPILFEEGSDSSD